MGSLVERLPPPPPAPVPRPAFSLAFYDHVVVWDGERWWFEALWSDERDAVLRERLGVWRARLRTMPAPPDRSAVLPGAFSLAANGAAGHLEAFGRLSDSAEHLPVLMDCQRALHKPKKVAALWAELRQS